MLKDLCFEIIQTCPNNCKFCSSNSSIDCKHIISFDIFKKVIDYFLSNGGIEEISLSGGEPFLHPDLMKMVAYCKANGIKTVIYTSGLMIRKKIPNLEKQNLSSAELNVISQYESNQFNNLDRKVLKELARLGLDKIVFDFQSSETDVFNELMGTSNQFVNVLNSILYAHFEGIESEIHFIPLKSNYKMINEIIKIAVLGEVKRISILRFVPQGRGAINKDELMLSEKEMEEFFTILSSIKNNSVDIRLGIPMSEKDTHLCTAGLNKIVIRYDGLILPCPAFKDIDLNILHENGVSTHSIYEDLDKVKIISGSRAKPLCKEIHFIKNNNKK